MLRFDYYSRSGNTVPGFVKLSHHKTILSAGHRRVLYTRVGFYNGKIRPGSDIRRFIRILKQWVAQGPYIRYKTRVLWPGFYDNQIKIVCCIDYVWCEISMYRIFLARSQIRPPIFIYFPNLLLNSFYHTITHSLQRWCAITCIFDWNHLRMR